MSKNSYHEESKPLLSRSDFQYGATISVQVCPNYTQDCIVDQSTTDTNCRYNNHDETNDTKCSPGPTDNELDKRIDEESATPKFQLLGVVLVILARMSFTGSNVIQKFVIPEVTFWQILAFRAIIQTLVMGFACLILHFKYRPGKVRGGHFRI